jgi:GR25 family glycosyltransferase involved in LPS biosynthesis
MTTDQQPPLRINRYPQPNAPQWRALFDRVVVLSLPASTERRRYIERHLPAFGLHDYAFFDATGADDAAVVRAYESGEVASYPTCFRCGGLDCGNDDCNNVLIAPQVATFITYLRLWREIANGTAGRVLVLEDDVRLHDHTDRVLGWLAAQVAEDRVPLTPGRASLLRLGWARCAEHEVSDRLYCSATVKMSNPCHALTREYAAALLERYRGIVHTADEYQHRLAPLPGEAVTVFPPIASELSWSEGTFASTIHPKTVRLQHLRSVGDVAGAAQHEITLRRHVKKKHFRPLLVVGHPRCGTGYASQLCSQLGLDIGHEKLGADGISSWMFAVEAEQNPYALDDVARTRRALAWKHLVMPVRDLASAAASVMRDSVHAPPSYAFRREHILRLTGLDLEALASPLERAVRSVTAWARIVLAQQPGLVFRIEDQHECLRDFLIQHHLCPAERRALVIDTSPVNADKPYGGVRQPKPEIDAAAWQSLPADTRAEIDWYGTHFGYHDPCSPS